MYFLSLNAETHQCQLTPKHFSKELITFIKKDVKDFTPEQADCTCKNIFVPDNLYTSALGSINAGISNPKQIILWRGELFIGIIQRAAMMAFFLTSILEN